MTNHGDFQRQFTSIMEKLLHNAVSEAMQLFENSVQELKVEIVRVRKENDNLNHKLYFSEKPQTLPDPGKSYSPITKDNAHKRDIGVQCGKLRCRWIVSMRYVLTSWFLDGMSPIRPNCVQNVREIFSLSL